MESGSDSPGTRLGAVQLVSIPRAGRLEGASDRAEFEAIYPKTAHFCNPLLMRGFRTCHLEDAS